MCWRSLLNIYHFVKMKLSHLFLFWVCFNPGWLSAENRTAVDSVRSNPPAERKDTIRIRPEYQKAIEDGTFLHLEGMDRMRMDQQAIPLAKDFSEYLRIDDTVRHVRRKLIDLPPAVTMLYGGMLQSSEKVATFRYSEREKQQLRDLTPGGLVTFSLEDIMQQIFWKSARAKKHNKKHATAWRYYNDLP